MYKGKVVIIVYLFEKTRQITYIDKFKNKSSLAITANLIALYRRLLVLIHNQVLSIIPF